MAEVYDWHDRAACRLTPDIDFFPEDGNVWPALEVCKGCPVKRQCREHAIENHEEYGVWGGTTAAERRREWRRLAVKSGR